MRKQLFTLLLVMLSLVTFGQQWVAINGNAPSKYQVELVASSDRNVTVDLQLSGFYTNEVTTPQGQAYVISAPKTVSVAAAGNPEVPMIPIPAVIGDRALMSVRIVSADYTDYENMEIAPSKDSRPSCRRMVRRSRLCSSRSRLPQVSAVDSVVSSNLHSLKLRPSHRTLLGTLSTARTSM